MDDEIIHVPVLYEEVLDYLQPLPNGRYIDGTVGAGGHTLGILKASAPDGRVLVFDKDPEAIRYTQMRLVEYRDRIVYVNASYAEMGTLAPAHNFSQVNGILLDLGLSSRQLSSGERGFSFQQEGPLDMRFNPTTGETAADLVNNLSESELADIFWQFGEMRNSRQIARIIVANRPITTTTELAQIISANVRKKGRIHPATQLFQALRIEVNRELVALETGVKAAVDLLVAGGRLAVISFHSLEDRFVKQFFRQLEQECTCPPQQPVCTCNKRAVAKRITRRVCKPSAEEISTNPRSRSARLRVIEKL